MRWSRRLSHGGLALLLVIGCGTWSVEAAGGESDEHGERTSRISDDSVPEIDPADFVDRPRPFIELGNPYLGTRNLNPGFRVPGGSVWQPSFIAFGAFRSGLQVFDDGLSRQSEWANRLDLFGNLQLTGTERLLVGFRPLDDDGVFTGRRFENDGMPADYRNGFNAEISTLFFEGDFGEIFPNLDRRDFHSLDWGFAVGRQAFAMQDGILINDTVDSIGIIRNTLLPSGGSDLQFTFVYGWNEVNRANNVEDRDAQIFGVFSAMDYPTSTINADAIYVFNSADGNDGVHWGVSAVQRIGHTSSTFRILGSHALDNEADTVSDGYLAMAELSWVPAWTHDLLYLNAFVAVDRFSSAARDPAAGGPLGRMGILYAAVGLGDFGAPLSNQAAEAVGFALGYQKFSHNTRRQNLFELGGRKSTTGLDDTAVGLGYRFQQALGQHFILQFNLFGAVNELIDETGWGTRVETSYVF